MPTEREIVLVIRIKFFGCMREEMKAPHPPTATDRMHRDRIFFPVFFLFWGGAPNGPG